MSSKLTNEVKFLEKQSDIITFCTEASVLNQPLSQAATF